jgi:hypothetical protein
MKDVLTPSLDCLLTYIDDTGNETFEGQRYFGLGGILLSARENELYLKPRWRALRKLILESEDAPLHASELGHARNLKHLEAVAAFFSGNYFLRFGVTTHVNANVPEQFTRRQPVYEMLKKYALVGSPVSCDALFDRFAQSSNIVHEFGSTLS